MGKHSIQPTRPVSPLVGVAIVVVLAVIAALVVMDRTGSREDATAAPTTRRTPASPSATSSPTPSTSPSPSPSPSPTRSRDLRPRIPFAEAGGVTLYLPVKEPSLIGFHESLLGSALTLRPIGELRQSDNGKYDPVPDSKGPEYVVMATRGRPTEATTSTDIVIPPETTVRSPVDGTILRIDDYKLYCEAWDQRVLIQPDEAPELRVVLLHVQDLKVHEGQRLRAGQTYVGHPRIFYNSHPQFDQYVPGDQRHVHVEIDDEEDPELPTC